MILESFFCEKKELECISSISDGCVDGAIIIKTIEMSRDSKLTYTCILPTITLKVNEFTRNTQDINCVGEKYFNSLLVKINCNEKN